MNKYKVEFIQTKTFIIDVKAKNEKEAIKKAETKLEKIRKTRTLHYHQIGDSITETSNIYDVTNTDDPFDE